MATVTKPIALDESINTTESPSRNIADVLAQELSGIASAITGGSDKAPKTDIATVEPSNTASRAYSVGELVYVNGNLYKVITAISIGATFTVGTNIQSTNVGSLINNYESGNITSVFPTTNLVKCCRSGNVVEFSIQFSGTTVPYGGALCNLPTGFRPRSDMYIVVSGRLINSGGNAYTDLLIRAETNGDIRQEVTTAGITSGYLQGMFIV